MVRCTKLIVRCNLGTHPLQRRQDVASEDPVFLAFAAQMRGGELHILLPENFDLEQLLRQLLVSLHLYLTTLPSVPPVYPAVYTKRTCHGVI